MANRIDTEAARVQQTMGMQTVAFHKNSQKLASAVANPAARLDQYEPSGEQAAELMMAVLERAEALREDKEGGAALLAEVQTQPNTQGVQDAQDTTDVPEAAKASQEEGTAVAPPGMEDEEALEGGEAVSDEEENGENGAAKVGGKADAGAAGAPAPSNVKATSETHCFCEGAKHGKDREGSEECYAIITAMTDAQGNPVDSPEVGQRKLLNDLEA